MGAETSSPKTAAAGTETNVEDKNAATNKFLEVYDQLIQHVQDGKEATEEFTIDNVKLGDKSITVKKLPHDNVGEFKNLLVFKAMVQDSTSVWVVVPKVKKEALDQGFRVFKKCTSTHEGEKSSIVLSEGADNVTVDKDGKIKKKASGEKPTATETATIAPSLWCSGCYDYWCSCCGCWKRCFRGCYYFCDCYCERCCKSVPCRTRRNKRGKKRKRTSRTDQRRKILKRGRSVTTRRSNTKSSRPPAKRGRSTPTRGRRSPGDRKSVV